MGSFGMLDWTKWGWTIVPLFCLFAGVLFLLISIHSAKDAKGNGRVGEVVALVLIAVAVLALGVAFLFFGLLGWWDI